MKFRIPDNLMRAIRLAPGALQIIFDHAKERRFPDRAREMVETRFWRFVERIAAGRPSPLEESQLVRIIERCFARVETDLIARVRQLDPTLEENTARRILDLPPDSSRPPGIAA